MYHMPIQTYSFFADESGISNDRYTVVGGVTVKTTNLPRVYKTMRDFRKRSNMNAELKWSKVSNGKETEYTDLVETFFALNNSRLIEFHAVAFDNHKWDHARFNDGDSDVGLSKLYYQLLLHCLIEPRGDQNSLFICLDHRYSSTSLTDVQKMLNSAAARDYGLAYGPVRQLVSRDSKKEELLQLNDVILGAITAVKNGRHLLAGGRQSKKNLAELVFERSGLHTLGRDSEKNARFTFWNRVPQ